MTQINTLLELRKKLKEKKPEFIRQDAHIKKIEHKWRKPKGIHSKMRHKIKGKRKLPSPGYKSPSKIRGMISGLKPLIVKSIKQMENLDAKSTGIIIGNSVGMKKRAEMVKKANEAGIKLLNIDGENYLKKVGELISKKKKEKEVKKRAEKTKDSKSVEVKKAKAEGEPIKEKPIAKEDKEKQEKKEKDKLLIKKA